MRVKTTRDVVILVVFLLSYIGGINAEEVADCDSNTKYGWHANGSITTGKRNTFIGACAGYSTDTGISNTFLGCSAGYSNKSGVQNTFVGSYAGYKNETGHNNIFIGYTAGYNNKGDVENEKGIGQHIHREQIRL